MLREFPFYEKYAKHISEGVEELKTMRTSTITITTTKTTFLVKSYGCMPDKLFHLLEEVISSSNIPPPPPPSPSPSPSSTSSKPDPSMLSDEDLDKHIVEYKKLIDIVCQSDITSELASQVKGKLKAVEEEVAKRAAMREECNAFKIKMASTISEAIAMLELFLEKIKKLEAMAKLFDLYHM